MAKPKRPGGPKQKLSPTAAKKKAERDKKWAMTPRRRAMKAENQRKRRASSSSVKGKDYDHTRGKFVSEKTNRSATKTTNNTMPGKHKKKGAPKKKKSITTLSRASRATTTLIKSLGKNKKKKTPIKKVGKWKITKKK